MSDEPQQNELKLQIHLPEGEAGGSWSNFALVHHSEHEFTIDFVRLDYARRTENGETPGIVVSRVGLSPLFVRQLISALEDNWAKYAKKAMPKEVYGDEPDRDQN